MDSNLYDMRILNPSKYNIDIDKLFTIHKQTLKLCRNYIKVDPYNIEYCRLTHPSLNALAVKSELKTFSLIDNPSNTLVIKALDLYYDLYLESFKKGSEVAINMLQQFDMNSDVVRKHKLYKEIGPFNNIPIDYFYQSYSGSGVVATNLFGTCHYQTEELCKFVVSNHAGTITYVKNPTMEIYEAAITNSPTVLRRIRNQTFDICKLAVIKSIENGNRESVLKYLDYNVLTPDEIEYLHLL